MLRFLADMRSRKHARLGASRKHQAPRRRGLLGSGERAALARYPLDRLGHEQKLQTAHHGDRAVTDGILERVGCCGKFLAAGLGLSKALHRLPPGVEPRCSHLTAAPVPRSHSAGTRFPGVLRVRVVIENGSYASRGKGQAPFGLHKINSAFESRIDTSRQMYRDYRPRSAPSCAS